MISREIVPLTVKRAYFEPSTVKATIAILRPFLKGKYQSTLEYLGVPELVVRVQPRVLRSSLDVYHSQSKSVLLPKSAAAPLRKTCECACVKPMGQGRKLNGYHNRIDARAFSTVRMCTGNIFNVFCHNFQSITCFATPFD